MLTPREAAAAGPIVVTTTADTGIGSLRWALTLANIDPLTADVIVFDIPGAGPHTIAPGTPLPNLASPVAINGFCGTCDGAHPNTKSMAESSDAIYSIVFDGSGLNAEPGFIVTGNNVSIRGLVVTRTENVGISVEETASNTVIAGNYIGTNAAGTVAMGNGYGVFLGGTNPRLGGTAAADRNVISGNLLIGADVINATNAIVKGNFIGVSASGSYAIGNGIAGLVVAFAQGTTIGGTTLAERNIISGNGGGGDGHAIAFYAAVNTKVLGNYIGVDRTGQGAIPNDGAGIALAHLNDGLQVGSALAGGGNVISANGLAGIAAYELAGTQSGLSIQGNRIGTNLNGTAALPNGAGITLVSAPGTKIGGAAAGEGNLIAASTGAAIVLGKGMNATDVRGNRIGVGANGVTAMGNGGDGIVIEGTPSPSIVTIGGPASGDGNLIANGGGRGIVVTGATSFGVSIRGNVIRDNAGQAIDLGGDGVTPNDAGDPDSGPNGKQNFPVLLSAVRGEQMLVGYEVETLPGQVVEVDFYAGATCGEPDIYLGAISVALDGDGFAEGLAEFANQPAGTFIVATVTDAIGNTSEFSPCAEVAPRPGSDADCNGTVDALDALAIMRQLAGFTDGYLPKTCLVDPTAQGADADGSGTVTVADAVYARRVAAGLS